MPGAPICSGSTWLANADTVGIAYSNSMIRGGHGLRIAGLGYAEDGMAPRRKE